MENFDLRKLLETWPYDPEDCVRKVAVEGGREVLQVRLPVGVEQYELDGRPDGRRPHDCESALEYQLERLETARNKGKESSFILNHEACEELFEEGTLYYYRYLYCFQVQDWQRTIRDTGRNLKLFDFVHEYAEEEEDQFYLEKWRAYLLRMNAAALAMVDLEDGKHADALDNLHRGIRSIEALPELDDEVFQFETQRSLATLKDLIEQIESAKPVSEVENLERQLRQAIESQAFEQAAELRDRIRALRNKP
jgi:hypothetical protein